MPTPIFDPLTLECQCEGSGLVVCGLVGLRMVGSGYNETTLAELSVSAPGLTPFTISSPAGYFDFNFGIDIRYADHEATVAYAMNRGLLLDATERAWLRWVVEADYVCITESGSWHVGIGKNWGIGDACSCTTSEPLLRSRVFLESGWAGGTIYYSSPLGV